MPPSQDVPPVPALAASDLLLPALILRQSALIHNIATMASYCREMGIALAPHGKTTMSPEIAGLQLSHGAWGITVADVRQAAVFRDAGVRRILIANEVTHPNSLAWLRAIRDTDHDFEIICCVDSVTGVDLAGGLFKAERALDVLIEVGFDGGRGGCRNLAAAMEVARKVAETPGLRLVGVSAYEGIIEDNEDLVDGLLQRVRELVQAIDDGGGFADVPQILVSAGGSIYFEQVVARLRSWSQTRPVTLMIRSGGYVTHDHGFYDSRSPWGTKQTGPRKLIPALEIWGEVLSTPEVGLAVVGFGRRHAPEDHGLPKPLLRRTSDGRQLDLPGSSIARLNDQHAYLVLGHGSELEVGDTVVAGISHPCTAFDKWRSIPMVDDDYRIVGNVRTLF